MSNIFNDNMFNLINDNMFNLSNLFILNNNDIKVEKYMVSDKDNKDKTFLMYKFSIFDLEPIIVCPIIFDFTTKKEIEMCKNSAYNINSLSLCIFMKHICNYKELMRVILSWGPYQRDIIYIMLNRSSISDVIDENKKSNIRNIDPNEDYYSPYVTKEWELFFDSKGLTIKFQCEETTYPFNFLNDDNTICGIIYSYIDMFSLYQFKTKKPITHLLVELYKLCECIKNGKIYNYVFTDYY